MWPTCSVRGQAVTLGRSPSPTSPRRRLGSFTSWESGCAAIRAPRRPRRRTAAASGLLLDRGDERDLGRLFSSRINPTSVKRTRTRTVPSHHSIGGRPQALHRCNGRTDDLTDRGRARDLLEIDKLREGGVTDAEAHARDELPRRRFPFRFESPRPSPRPSPAWCRIGCLTTTSTPIDRRFGP